MKKRKKPKKKVIKRKVKKPEKQGKATGVQSLIRQNAVFKLLLAGQPRRYIIEYCGKKWGIKRSQVDLYIEKAKDIWEGLSTESRQAELAMEIERANDLFRTVLKKKNYLTALSTLKHICTLKRLNNLEIDFKGAITLEARLEGMSDEELEKNIQENIAQLKQDGFDVKGAVKKKAPEACRE